MTTRSALKTHLRETWHRAWDTGDVDALDDLLAPDYTRTTQGSDRILSAAEFKEDVAASRTAFPDLVTSISHVLADGDDLAVFWSSTGTHLGELLGIPATRRRVTIYGSNLCTVSDGRISSERVTWDPRQLLDALGISTVRHD